MWYMRGEKDSACPMHLHTILCCLLSFFFKREMADKLVNTTLKDVKEFDFMGKILLKTVNRLAGVHTKSKRNADITFLEKMLLSTPSHITKCLSI